VGLFPELAHFGEGPTIEYPAAAVVGEPFAIVITTFGGGCIEQGPTNVVSSGRRIDIRPMDVFSRVGANSALSFAGDLIERRAVAVSRHIRSD